MDLEYLEDLKILIMEKELEIKKIKREEQKKEREKTAKIERKIEELTTKIVNRLITQPLRPVYLPDSGCGAKSDLSFIDILNNVSELRIDLLGFSDDEVKKIVYESGNLVKELGLSTKWLENYKRWEIKMAPIVIYKE